MRRTYPLDIRTIQVPGKDAVKLLHEYRAKYHATGEYPFLIGDDKELESVMQCGEGKEERAADIIQQSFDLSIDERIEHQRWYLRMDGDRTLAKRMGKWPGGLHDNGSICAHQNISTKEFLPTVHLGFAKIEKPWHLPAALKMGQWNNCPDAATHCLFHRLWYEEYGSEIVSVMGDVVECIVSRPPTTKEAAMKLALAQFWYCEDIVDQGTRTISKLAAAILKWPYWFFWWD